MLFDTNLIAALTLEQKTEFEGRDVEGFIVCPCDWIGFPGVHFKVQTAPGKPRVVRMVRLGHGSTFMTRS